MNQDTSSAVTVRPPPATSQVSPPVTPPPGPLPTLLLPAPAPRRGSSWAAVAASFAALGVLWLVGGVLSAGPLPLQFMIDGSPVLDGLALQDLTTTQRLLLAVAALAVLLAALVIMPLALLWVAALLLLALLGLVGPPLLALAAVLALLMSPLWLAGWLLWRFWRRARRRSGPV